MWPRRRGPASASSSTATTSVLGNVCILLVDSGARVVAFRAQPSSPEVVPGYQSRSELNDAKRIRASASGFRVANVRAPVNKLSFCSLTRARRPDNPSMAGAASPPSALAAWTCPLTGQLFVEPVLYLAPNDGAAQIYERAALEQQLALSLIHI